MLLVVSVCCVTHWLMSSVYLWTSCWLFTSQSQLITGVSAGNATCNFVVLVVSFIENVGRLCHVTGGVLLHILLGSGSGVSRLVSHCLLNSTSLPPLHLENEEYEIIIINQIIIMKSIICRQWCH